MSDDTSFRFKSADLADGELRLELVEQYPGDPARQYVPAYRFQIQAGEDAVGKIELRVGDTEDLILYAGQIAYEVEPLHRGHRYAARACKLLLPLARSYGLQELWITCNPENVASRRTCELAEAEWVGIVDLPEHNEMYHLGDRRKCRYRISLDPEVSALGK